MAVSLLLSIFSSNHALTLKMHHLKQSNPPKIFFFPQKNSLFQKGLLTTWKCSGFPGGGTSSTRAEAHDSSRYLACYYPIAPAYSSLKIGDDGTCFPGHTPTLFLVNCLLYFQPRNSGYSEPYSLLKNSMPNRSSRFQPRGEVDYNPFRASCGQQSRRLGKRARPPPGDRAAAMAEQGVLEGERDLSNSEEKLWGWGTWCLDVKSKKATTALHKHGGHASPLPGLKAIVTPLLRRFTLRPGDQHGCHLYRRWTSSSLCWQFGPWLPARGQEHRRQGATWAAAEAVQRPCRVRGVYQPQGGSLGSRPTSQVRLTSCCYRDALLHMQTQ